jgi:hypothetical protein
LVNLTWRQYRAKYPDRTHDAYRSMRRSLRDAGAVFPDGRSQPERYLAAPEVTIETGVENLAELPREKIWELVRLGQEMALRRQQEQVQSEITVRIDTDRPIGIVFMSDFHIGNVGTDYEALNADIDLIRTCPLLKAMIGGDGIDNFIVPKLAAAHRDGAVLTIDLQWFAFHDVLTRLLGQILAVGTGNHDAWTRKMAGIDGMDAMIGDLPIVNTGERSLIHLCVGDQSYRIFRKHRPIFSSSFNPGHAVAQLWRMGEVDFDLGVVEHQHVSYYGTFTGHGKERLAIRTGSYKVLDSFASEFTMLNGGGVGTPVVVFDPHVRKMSPFGSISDAIVFLVVE